jgi:hypothetical protein
MRPPWGEQGLVIERPQELLNSLLVGLESSLLAVDAAPVEETIKDFHEQGLLGAGDNGDRLVAIRHELMIALERLVLIGT